MRWIGLYGDPQPWSIQSNWLSTLLSFLDCEKYPPSLLYLLMTLGPLFLLYPLINKFPVRLVKCFEVFGRVPLFVYVIHIPLLHFLAITLSFIYRMDHDWLLGGFPLLVKPTGYGLNLIEVYFAWMLVILLLYPLSRAYGQKKMVSRKRWHWLL